ncbi:tRNA (adenosine(37)-N6)-threonylcarbamoyltransferase complex dimerization subunit type 1 TsaB [Filimonas effusa]|uniref:tRNA (Adenosine(37)-N6)-threonylcarbamoyltransferase complex dimerization subunit type 1 TsaB n=1 Tax=Filimonas effusa TaxID=2508721 RepID=A0A4Q1D6Y6_9BACT|nr:tRNA (adenosine(37)-N6)-threonylcarbamoyltransferase complex dimerization subunit type 1 TsaB [Filimonas effusa]RXK83437.1 tRNA (adenosine(37)-N6)-threonylcarbamoyltransferase complex dimerization subunit type 1 TsaB [Filimonas effusa]
MALILNIDTATERAGVCLSMNGKVLHELQHEDQKNHAGFVQPAVSDLMLKSGYKLADLDAIAVTAGPGSYTGLRVGLATAKGLCFTLSKPLLMVNTLEVMAQAVLRAEAPASDRLLCPMIDARRMEVFTGMYTTQLQVVQSPSAVILTDESFKEILDKQVVMFTGNGSTKFKEIITHDNALFSNVQHEAGDLGVLAELAFRNNQVADLAYSEPYYLKEFFNPTMK